MTSSPLPDPLQGVLSRVESLRNGLSASTSLPPDAALVEVGLILDDAIERSVQALLDAPALNSGLSRLDARLLLSAERYWLEILRDILRSEEDLPAPVRLDRVIASVPR